MRAWSTSLLAALLCLPRLVTAQDGGVPAEAPDDAAAASQPAAGDSGRAATSQPASQPAERPDARPPLPEWAPKLSASVKPAMALLGDPVTMTITVRHRRGISVTLPLQLELGKFTELSREDRSRDLAAAKGQISDLEQVFVLRLAAYELGELTLPPIEVTALGPRGELIALRTEPIPIRIRGVLRNEPNAKPKGLEPPVSVFQRTWLLVYLTLALAAAGIVVAVTLLLSRRLRERRERLRPPPPPVPAHIVALERLAAIRVEELIAAQRYKELYLLLSEIVRQYVGGRWGFDALEMTTTEISDALAARSVSEEARARFDRYFESCDLVKFAKYRPEAQAAREGVQEAIQLVRSTSAADQARPDAPPPAATTPPSPGGEHTAQGGDHAR